MWPLQADNNDPEVNALTGPAAAMEWLCGEIDHSDITVPRSQPWERVQIKQHAFDPRRVAKHLGGTAKASLMQACSSGERKESAGMRW